MTQYILSSCERVLCVCVRVTYSRLVRRFQMFESVVLCSLYNGLITKFLVPLRLLKLLRRISLSNVSRSNCAIVCRRWPSPSQRPLPSFWRDGRCIRWSSADSVGCSSSWPNVLTDDHELTSHSWRLKRFRSPYVRTEHNECDRFSSCGSFKSDCMRVVVSFIRRKVIGKCSKRYLHCLSLRLL